MPCPEAVKCELDPRRAGGSGCRLAAGVGIAFGARSKYGAPTDPDLTHGYAYDAHVIRGQVTNADLERGPPARMLTRISAPAGDPGSYGTFAIVRAMSPARNKYLKR